jgi:putative ABC transport system substrate-binding protein
MVRAMGPAGKPTTIVPALSRRRVLAAGPALVTVAASPPLSAQRARKTLGYLALTERTRSMALPSFRAFVEALRGRGWVAGETLNVEYRFADNDAGRLPELARDLVARRPDVIFAQQRPTVPAARAATSVIPIVFMSYGDPVAEGWVESLARPGGNLTGVAGISAELAEKRIEFLREIVPALQRIGVIWNPVNRGETFGLAATERAGRAVGVAVTAHPVADVTEFERVRADIARSRAQGIVVLPDPYLSTQRHALMRAISALKLPAIFTEATYLDVGALMTYGPSLSEMSRRAAAFVDRILRGARPAELPVELPTKFELVINQKAAVALGITVPAALLARASEIID